MTGTIFTPTAQPYSRLECRYDYPTHRTIKALGPAPVAAVTGEGVGLDTTGELFTRRWSPTGFATSEDGSAARKRVVAPTADRAPATGETTGLERVGSGAD